MNVSTTDAPDRREKLIRLIRKSRNDLRDHQSDAAQQLRAISSGLREYLGLLPSEWQRLDAERSDRSEIADIDPYILHSKKDGYARTTIRIALDADAPITVTIHVRPYGGGYRVRAGDVRWEGPRGIYEPFYQAFFESVQGAIPHLFGPAADSDGAT